MMSKVFIILTICSTILVWLILGKLGFWEKTGDKIIKNTKEMFVEDEEENKEENEEENEEEKENE